MIVETVACSDIRFLVSNSNGTNYCDRMIAEEIRHGRKFDKSDRRLLPGQIFIH